MRVLVIEDDREMAQAIASGLRQQRFAVDVVFDGAGAFGLTEVSERPADLQDRPPLKLAVREALNDSLPVAPDMRIAPPR